MVALGLLPSMSALGRYAGEKVDDMVAIKQPAGPSMPVAAVVLENRKPLRHEALLRRLQNY